MEAWHVATIRPGFEHVGFEALGCVWPRWVERRAERGRITERVRALAPGYLMVRFGADAVGWHRVASACGEGFRGFIGGEFPDAVGDTAMASFLARCADVTGLMILSERDDYGLRRYRPGEVVRLVGVLGAVSGAVTWADDRGVRVTTTMFNRQTELWLPRGSGMIEGETAATARPRDHRCRKNRTNSMKIVA